MKNSIDFDELKRLKEECNKTFKAERRRVTKRFYEEMRLKTEAFTKALPEKAKDQAKLGRDHLCILVSTDIGYRSLSDECWNIITSECKRLFPYVKENRETNIGGWQDNITCYAGMNSFF